MNTSRAVHARWSALLILALTLSSCGGGGGGSPPQCPNTCPYTVGGTVAGLATGNSVVLLLNGGDPTTVSANTTFTFATVLPPFTSYGVTVGTPPAGQTCTVTDGSGFGDGLGSISNVSVTCAANPKFAYVSGTDIYCFAVDAVTGALTALAGSPCASGGRTGVAVDPSGAFAYATLNSSNEVTAYMINSSTGSLAAISGSQLNGGGTNPVDITIDPSGQFVYMANYAGSISAFKINSVTGGLTTVPGSPFPTAPPVPPSNNSGVNSVTVDPTGKFVYAALNGSNAISAYTINSGTGALTTVVGSPFPAGSVPMMVRVDPSGRYAYATNMDSNDISAYSVNSSTGALTPIMGSPFPFPTSGGAPTGLAVDPSGRFVYVTGQNSNNVSAFSMDNSTGVLTPISGSPFASGAGPWGAFVEPSGRFLYVTNNGEGTISAYSIDSTSGSLAPISGSPFKSSGTGTGGTYAIAFSK